MDLVLPKLDFTELVLSPAEEPTRGDVELPMDQFVTIGGPVALPLLATDDAQDADVKAFIEARSQGFRFHLVYLAFSARPPEDQPLASVLLSLALRRTDGGAPDPIALSMTPRVLNRPVELSRTVKLSVPLKVVDAAVERAEKTSSQEAFLQSYNELRPDPYWEFREVTDVPIRGSQRLCLVVQAPHVPCEGSLTVQVRVRRRRLGIFPYTAAPRDGSPITFAINQ